MIPCTDTCRWQRSGECTLDTCENPTGQPSKDHPCLHYQPVIFPGPAAAVPGKYLPPAAAPIPQVLSDPSHDAQGSYTV